VGLRRMLACKLTSIMDQYEVQTALQRGGMASERDPQNACPCIPSHQHSGHYQLERLGLDRCGNQDGTTSWIVHDAKRINDLTLPEG
jgi:hypothetical protein